MTNNTQLSQRYYYACDLLGSAVMVNSCVYKQIRCNDDECERAERGWRASKRMTEQKIE